MPDRLTHLDETGAVRIVDIADKAATRRRAVAGARLLANRETLDAIASAGLKKGDAVATARIAGIMAAKKTAELIPLCHPIALTRVEIEITSEADHLAIRAIAETTGRTGVEMEALTAAATAALTLYDMAKALDRAMTITDIRLIEKSGGRSGDYRRDEAT